MNDKNLVLRACVAILWIGCASSQTNPGDAGMPPPDSGVVDDSGPRPDVGPPGDGGPITCPPLDQRELVEITEDITSDQSWDCQHLYILLTNTPVFVRPPAVVRIGPGTVIQGDRQRAALIFARGSRIEAVGTPELPIVFTSSQPEGSRRDGDWGGLALLGRAVVTDGRLDVPPGGARGEFLLDGLETTGPEAEYGYFGGTDDTWSCGTLRYVRIEFGGNELSPENELNGLSLNGCGSQTDVEYVQVHRSADDGVELYGGTTRLRHIVITQSEDDGLDWDRGWRGMGQYILIQGRARSGESEPLGIEADNDYGNFAAMPVAEPHLWNVTVVGPDIGTTTADRSKGVVARRGTGGHFHNFLIMGWRAGGLDVRDVESVALANTSPSRLYFTHSLLYRNGIDGTSHFVDFEPPTQPDNFDEGMWWMRDATNRIDVDPMLPAPYSVDAPSFVPPVSSPLATGAETPSGDPFLDPEGAFVGAIEPGADVNWTTGWTAFPVD